VTDSPVVLFVLGDDEVQGELVSKSDDICEVMSDRIIVGRNAPWDELLVASRYSQTLLPKESAIQRLVQASMPKELTTKKGDTRETILAKQVSCRWLDEIHKHDKTSTLANGDPGYKCAMRRTMAVVTEMPHAIEDPQDPDHGRLVTDMFSMQIRSLLQYGGQAGR
jgi:hypothetical protein